MIHACRGSLRLQVFCTGEPVDVILIDERTAETRSHTAVTLECGYTLQSYNELSS